MRTAADSLEEVDYVKGDVIIQQDDVGDSFFLLEEGTVSVLKKSSHGIGEGVTKELAQLGKNSHFGDGMFLYALLSFVVPKSPSRARGTRINCLILLHSFISFYFYL